MKRKTNSYHDNGFATEHFGAFRMIQMAPANIAAHSTQNKMKKIQRNRCQNGSFAYFINSSLVIPEKLYKIEQFTRRKKTNKTVNLI